MARSIGKLFRDGPACNPFVNKWSALNPPVGRSCGRRCVEWLEGHRSTSYKPDMATRGGPHIHGVVRFRRLVPASAGILVHVVGSSPQERPTRNERTSGVAWSLTIRAGSSSNRIGERPDVTKVTALRTYSIYLKE